MLRHLLLPMRLVLANCPGTILTVALASLCVTAAHASADNGTLERRFGEVVQPFVKTYCLSCHGLKKQEAKLDLSGFDTAAKVAKRLGLWDHVHERVAAEEMPPARAARQPGAHERTAFLDWLRQFRKREAERHAGDPGIVLARRLNQAEYDNTIRDLTGVDLRPAKEFPVDPANEAGFDNSGESLVMSPGLLKKYLAAARAIADHLVLKPHGFAFAPGPIVADSDRDKYCVQRIMAFYDRHRVDYADYLYAVWQYQLRAKQGKPNDTLADFAARQHLTAKYLERIGAVLTSGPSGPGPLGEIRSRWLALPTDPRQEKEARVGCERLRDRILELRKTFQAKEPTLQAPGISQGSQPFLLWRNAQLAGQHQSPGSAANAEVAEFCRIFPDAFVVTERAPYYDPESTKEGRLLSAGFHLMCGFGRDDGPLCDLVLTDAEKQELNQLWEELHFITRDPIRQYKDFIFFERAEPPGFIQDPAFDFARSEDKDAIRPAKIQQLRDAYVAKARKAGASAPALEAIQTYFTTIRAQIEHVESARRAAEPSHLAALQAFAARAFRRPLTTAERDQLLTFYRKLRDQDQLGHEEALRDTVAYVLLSPNFCYRLDLAPAETAAGPLPDYALASRLSYFLWASMPDSELFAHAAAGDLHQPTVLRAQTRRMLRDPRCRGFAEQFAGNWLEFRRFEDLNTVDRQRFGAFTNELRQAMAEEPIRLLLHIAGQGGSVLDLLDANYVIVNAVLARHYGIPFPAPSGTEAGHPEADRWAKVEGARQYGRGGVLPMAVFLTKNSPGLRTSPVKRGYWVVRRLLGEHIPPPPPEVPELPKDEAKLGDHTLAELLAQHRAHPSCAGCHRRFDALGLAFEGYGPIGEARTRDLGGRPVETTVAFPDGRQGNGLDGLRQYLKARRTEDFLNHFCNQLLAYALGRTLLPSDQFTIDQIRATIEKENLRLDRLVEEIVISPQFLTRRGREDLEE